MSQTVYRICVLLTQALAHVPLGTNQGLCHLLWALLTGRFLASRGAVFPALDALGLAPDAVRRAVAALAYGQWDMARLLTDWQQVVLNEGKWVAHSHDGVRAVPVDVTGFFRPRLGGCATTHYTSQAGKALPAQVFGMVSSTGSVEGVRLCLPRLLEPMPADTASEAAFAKSLVRQAAKTLASEETLVLDAGFSLADLRTVPDVRFVLRVARNFTARKNVLPVSKGVGRPAVYGALVRPLPRAYRGKTTEATPPDSVVTWQEGDLVLHACLYDHLTLPNATPGGASFRCVVLYDPRYKEPLVLVTNLPASVSPEALRGLYRDRWAVEQMPLAAKQMLGAGRAFVFAQESRKRLPLLALLAGNVLSYLAATSAPSATGFWDRSPRPTCGRLRRVLAQVHFSDLPDEKGRVRKKASVTGHLLTGVLGHRRKKKPKPTRGLTRAA